jgi:methanogenic corrinoid protein MtbC1
VVGARRFDDAGAQAAFDRLVAAFSIETVAATAILPYLRVLGERWRAGDASVAQEHFASGLLRARLLGLARGWDRGAGPRALLACPPRERHDLGLIILGLALRDRGWRLTFLGPDTPIETLAAAADQLAPDVVVLSSLAREPLAAAGVDIARLATRHNVFLAGPGADAATAEGVGASLLAGGPLEAAADVSV